MSDTQATERSTMFVVRSGEWSAKYGRYVYPAFTDRDTHDDIASHVENRWHAVEYTRTDIAEARIAELEAECKRLRNAVAFARQERDQAEWKRDALQRQIDGADCIQRSYHAAYNNAVIFDAMSSGKRVALVVLGDDE